MSYDGHGRLCACRHHLPGRGPARGPAAPLRHLCRPGLLRRPSGLPASLRAANRACPAACRSHHLSRVRTHLCRMHLLARRAAKPPSAAGPPLCCAAPTPVLAACWRQVAAKQPAGLRPVGRCGERLRAPRRMPSSLLAPPLRLVVLRSPGLLCGPQVLHGPRRPSACCARPRAAERPAVARAAAARGAITTGSLSRVCCHTCCARLAVRPPSAAWRRALRAGRGIAQVL